MLAPLWDGALFDAGRALFSTTLTTRRCSPPVDVRRMAMTYSDTQLFIDGGWTPAADGATIDVVNPASGSAVSPRRASSISIVR